MADDVSVSLEGILKYICQLASPLHSVHPCSSCTFILGTENGHMVGGESIIFALEDHQSRQVGVRIQRMSTDPYVLIKEVEHLKAIENHKIPQFQKLLGYQLQGNQLIRSPFMALEWAVGTPLIWTDTSPVNVSQRDQIIHAVAQATVDLLQIQKLGSSAREYMTTRIDRKIERALRKTYAGGDVESCREQLELLDEFWIPSLDSAPSVLIHGDLAAQNIIVDSDYKVQKIIDLGWSDMAPLQFAACYPRFLVPEPTPKYLQDGSVSYVWPRKETSMMARDRAFYLECIEKRALTDKGIALDFYKVLVRSDERRRYWWFRAVHQLDAHRAMDACDWQPDDIVRL